MKVSKIKSVLFVALAGVFLMGCAGLGSMEKHIKELGAKSSPEPLVLKGGEVEVNITGKFPPKYFPKKVVAEATPVLTWNGGEQAYKMQGYQGEAAAGNYTVIPFKTGASFSYSDKIDYVPAMANSTLELRIHGTKGNKSKDFTPLKIGTGVITTCLLVQNDDQFIMSTDNFKRVHSLTKEAIINYDYNKSNVKRSEMKDDDIIALEAFVKEVLGDDRKDIKQVTFMAYASPEGEISLNENLAKERAASGDKAIQKLIKKAGMVVETTDGFFVEIPKGEDWDGFKKLMQASNIEDQNLILRVLEMETDKAKREREIRNMAKTYREIENTILPQLRRTVVTVKYDVTGYSDDELKSISLANPDVMDIEELLRAGTLQEDLNSKLAVYQAAARLFPQDYRAINNLGVIQYQMNMRNDAKSSFEKAYNTTAAPEVANNLGAINRQEGNLDRAMELFNEAGSANATLVNFNKALVYIAQGDYDSALSNMGNNNTFNAALVKLLNGDAAGAKSDMDANGDDRAIADYLRAIIAVHTNNSADVLKYLRDAVAKDPSLAAKAKKDVEFRNFASQFNF